MSDLTLPSYQNGRSLMLDPEVEEIANLLHYGYAPMGWAGDEALALYRGPERRWELWRLEDDGEMRMVVRSKPDQPLDLTLIQALVERDRRRAGVNAIEQIIRDNEANDRRKEQEAIDALCEPMDKVLWGIKKDLGHLY